MKDLNLDVIDFNIYVDTVKKFDELYYRNKLYYEIIYCWMKNRNDNKYISNMFIKKGIKSIAIYGSGNLGELLYGELKNTDGIDIKYIIDKNNINSNFNNIPIFNLKELKLMDKVDIIVVTPIYAYDLIKKELFLMDIKNIICLDEVIFETSKQ